jgi:hypothetical protein
VFILVQILVITPPPQHTHTPSPSTLTGGGGTSRDPGVAAATAEGVEVVRDALIAAIPCQPRPAPTPDTPPPPLLFAVDHCFALRGQGTVMTGTVLQVCVCIWGDGVGHCHDLLNVAGGCAAAQVVAVLCAHGSTNSHTLFGCTALRCTVLWCTAAGQCECGGHC